MRKATVFTAIAVVFGLSACNSTLDNRTQKRIAIGAALGALGTVVVDGDPIAGAIVGGVAGGLTSKDRLVWE